MKPVSGGDYIFVAQRSEVEKRPKALAEICQPREPRPKEPSALFSILL